MNDNKRFTNARAKGSGKIIHINDLPRIRNGLKCDCVCVICKEPLQACQGYIRKWYFRHQTKTNCDGGPMTALHLLAQQLLSGNQIIKTEYGTVYYFNAVSEYSLPNSQFRADIGGFSELKQLFILEIFVNHKVESPKQEYYRTNKIHSIEIDLSEIDPDVNSYDLSNILLNDISIQNVLYSPYISKKNQSVIPKSRISYLLGLVALATFVYGLVRFLIKNSRGRRRKY